MSLCTGSARTLNIKVSSIDIANSLSISNNAMAGSVDNCCIIGNNQTSLVDNDTILNGIRFFRVGSQVHSARIVKYAARAREWKHAWEMLSGDRATYPGIIPADIRGLVAPLLHGDDREIFMHMLTAALERGNIAEVVGTYQEPWCWRVAAQYSNWFKLDLLIGQLNAAHRAEFRAVMFKAE